MTPALSITIATAGQRPSLHDTLAALVPQLGDGDEVLVLLDGPPSYEVLRIVRDWRAASHRVRSLHVDGGPHGDWGHTARNVAIASRWNYGSHLLWIDDDCQHRPGALASIRQTVAAVPGMPHLFQVCRHLRDGSTETIWRQPELREGNVGTMSVCVPNDPTRLGRWGDRYAGDFDYIHDTITLYRGACVWDDVVIADVFPAMEGRP